MAKANYKNVRAIIANILCDDDFAIVDAAMAQMGDAKLIVGTETVVFGKEVDTFQTGVEVENGKITGTLKYVADQWTEAGFAPEDHYFVYLAADTTLDADLYDVLINNVKVNAPENPKKDIVLRVKKPTGKKLPKAILQIKDLKTGEFVKEETYQIDVEYTPENNEPETVDENANS